MRANNGRRLVAIRLRFETKQRNSIELKREQTRRQARPAGHALGATSPAHHRRAAPPPSLERPKSAPGPESRRPGRRADSLPANY